MIIGFVACTSPLDVPANREEYIDNAKSNSLLNITPTTLNFGYINLYEEAKMPFQMTNMNTYAYKLTSLNFGKNTKFFLYDLDLPIEIDKKDTPGSIQLFHVRFAPFSIGEFSDTLETNGLTNPKLIVQAIVPHIFVTDLNFGTIYAGDSTSRNIMVYNYSGEKISVKEIKFHDQDGVFYCNSYFDTEIDLFEKTGKPLEIPITFYSTKESIFNASLEIIFEQSLSGKLIKNTAILEAAAF